eukprot:CAMPEP_0172050248 /NCGR_PEP_ID=MMETSP1043-20130122/2506_1 /TAXON_ID=464988 /ORGANISM="Hemiselmis andersenii, Strain CCMP441" /LENGTH=103 /DNA_ID=CAMNT_0012709287 /DNA_START=453 /DNA_END=760 /DNA_ORIENTATION=-
MKTARAGLGVSGSTTALRPGSCSQQPSRPHSTFASISDLWVTECSATTDRTTATPNPRYPPAALLIIALALCHEKTNDSCVTTARLPRLHQGGWVEGDELGSS